jgi:hypothetical protein
MILDLLDSEPSYLEIITHYTHTHYCFVICYITLAWWLCHHIHVTRLWVLLMGTTLLASRLSVYRFVADLWDPRSSSTAVCICNCQ